MKDIFDIPKIDVIKVFIGNIFCYLGCSGIGKTTAIQKIIRD
jgi:ABC-type transporter Mla maintaining outer membrane lipid asymmetry ATPase subunit MlaF